MTGVLATVFVLSITGGPLSQFAARTTGSPPGGDQHRVTKSKELGGAEFEDYSAPTSKEGKAKQTGKGCTSYYKDKSNIRFQYRAPQMPTEARFEEVKKNLGELYTERFTASRLRPELPFERFKKKVLGFEEANSEWDWGHHLYFGDRGAQFVEVGTGEHMADKWLENMAKFIAGYDMPLETVKGAEILDVGTWAGATTYMLAALGAKKIVSVEFMEQYSAFTHYVSESYQLPVETMQRDLYALESPDLRGKFDIVYFPGVLYHISDPLLALRILYNCLKDVVTGNFSRSEAVGRST